MQKIKNNIPVLLARIIMEGKYTMVKICIKLIR